MDEKDVIITDWEKDDYGTRRDMFFKNTFDMLEAMQELIDDNGVKPESAQVVQIQHDKKHVNFKTIDGEIIDKDDELYGYTRYIVGFIVLVPPKKDA